jgi:hypothetical protein
MRIDFLVNMGGCGRHLTEISSGRGLAGILDNDMLALG